MAEVARRYRSGETQEAISASLGVSQKAVRRILDQLGEPLHTPCPVSGVHRQTILAQYAEGESIMVISAKLGANRQRIVDLEGFAVRPRMTSRKVGGHRQRPRG